MKLLLLLACLVTPLLADELPVLASPDFKSPLDSAWKIAHGTYEPKDGVLVCAEKAENKHVAVLWHQVGWNTGLIECEFRLDGSKVFILGCDGNTAAGLKHVGRFVVTPKQISIAEDSIKPSQTLAKLPADLKSGVWHKLHLEWNGDQIAIQLDELALQARHAFLATPKTRSWIAVGGQTASIRGLKISGKP
jgi:hypothetical protein